LLLFFRKEEASFLKERSKELLYYKPMVAAPPRLARQVTDLSGTQGVSNYGFLLLFPKKKRLISINPTNPMKRFRTDIEASRRDAATAHGECHCALHNFTCAGRWRGHTASGSRASARCFLGRFLPKLGGAREGAATFLRSPL